MMKMVLNITIILAALMTGAMPACFSAEKTNDLIVLCYHDIPKEVNLDNFAVDQKTFINTIEYFRTHDFHFISLHDLIDADQGKKALPSKAVLLTFDDAYASYYDFVFPILREYRIPSVLAVVSSWIEKPPPEIKQKIMTWNQLKEVAKSDLVEIASHSHDLHKGIIYNPQGNEDAAAVAKFFNSKKSGYEEDADHQKRVWDDVLKSKNELEDRLDVKVRSIAWPYGKYNAIGLEGAKKAGIDVSFTLNDKRSAADNLGIVERFLVYKNPEIDYLMRFLEVKPAPPEQERIMQVDLDTIYDDDPAQVEKNLSALLERVKQMRVTTVYLQAFADPEGTGNVKAVYFPNKILHVRMDLFSRVVHQLRTRSLVKVYAWMPMLSIIFPDQVLTHQLQVKKVEDGEIVDSNEPYQRLSPFNEEVLEKVYQLYSAMAESAPVDGVLFQDDAYLTDFEDFSPAGLKEFEKVTGAAIKDLDSLTSDQRKAWTQRKTEKLLAFSEALKKAVRYYRPEARFARNLYPEVLTNPRSEEWFAQNYQRTLDSYDYAVVMVYPYLEGVKGNLNVWFKKLVDAAKAHPHGLKKTVFKIQTQDWRKKTWIKTETLNQWLTKLVGEGAYNLGYYPDDVISNHPKAEVIRLMMSTEEYPYPRK